jgi:thiol:disulfide interchange protein DsbC
MLLRSLFLTGAVMFAGAGLAADDVQRRVSDALHQLAPQAKVHSVTPSPLPGLYRVVADGHVVFISADGRYLISGEVVDLATHRSLTEDGLAELRKEGLARIPADQRLSFAPSHPKYTVTVFTDVDCPYCREFHKQIAEYNALGIAVDYVLYPLAIHPGADKKAVTVWCAKDRNRAYTEAMNGVNLPPQTCANPVAELRSIATSIGVDGTPAIFTANGVQLGGYLPPKQLAERLDQLALDKVTAQ